MNRLHFLKVSWEIWLGSIILAGFILIAAAAPILAPIDPNNEGAPYIRIIPGPRTERSIPKPPNEEAVLGTTKGQVDIYHALVWGTRNALKFSLLVSGSAFILGTLLGLLGGFFGGRLNWILLRLTDSFLAIPMIAGVILMLEMKLVLYQKFGGDPELILLGAQVIVMPWWFTIAFSIELVLVLFLWMPYMRLVNSRVQVVKTSLFIEASRALGMSNFKLMMKHILPNSITPAVVQLSRDLGGVVLIQAALTYLGLGGNSVWGILLVIGKDWVFGLRGNPFQYWWVFIPACLAIILFGAAWSLLGDGINNLLNPHRG
jgi:peptide/nickel transport system permease protein